MLCDICQRIFSEPRKLSYGTYYPWGHTSKTYEIARHSGCHLCNLVWENSSYSHPREPDFPKGCTYAFKSLNPEWAKHGKGAKWLVPQAEDSFDEDKDIETYIAEIGKDPTSIQLGNILSTTSKKRSLRSLKFWIVLDFYCPGPRIVLPLELAKDNKLEKIAQGDLENQSSTGSPQTLQLASYWYQQCNSNHQKCGPKSDSTSSTWLPTRLLHIGCVDSPQFRLVSGAKLKDVLQYASLSHRWGSSNHNRLIASRLLKWEHGISSEEISATVRDAAHATRSIGIQYLWVDYMCIVQDDPDDWRREATTMSKVYGNAACTLVSAASGDGDTGMFVNRNQYAVRPCLVRNPFSTESNLSFYIRSQFLNEIYGHEVIDSPWYQRGWVFQERLLSPRLLIFGKTQVLWACSKCQASESWPSGRSNTNWIDQFRSFKAEKRYFNSLTQRNKFSAEDVFRAVLLTQIETSENIEPHIQTFLHQNSFGLRVDIIWNILITEYSKSILTKTTDRLIALQGIASAISSKSGREYCSGHWIDSSLPYSLLWKVVPLTRPRPLEIRAPTWSWASVDGRIKFTVPKKDSLYSIGVRNFQSVPSEFSPTPIHSVVPLAALQMTGTLIPATLTCKQNIKFIDSFVLKEKRTKTPLAKAMLDIKNKSRRNTKVYCVPIFVERRSASDMPKQVKGLILMGIEGRENVFERLGTFDFDSGPTLPAGQKDSVIVIV